MSDVSNFCFFLFIYLYNHESESGSHEFLANISISKKLRIGMMELKKKFER